MCFYIPRGEDVKLSIPDLPVIHLNVLDQVLTPSSTVGPLVTYKLQFILRRKKVQRIEKS